MNQEAPAASLSIIVPAKNEASVIGEIVSGAREQFPDSQIIVVDDGSTDGTGDAAREAGAVVIRHPESLGNGAAVKAGARVAEGEVLAFMDGDGQHDPREFLPLLERMQAGYQMAIGSRDAGSHANVGRFFANGVYNWFASLLSGRRIPDLTSGFRVVRAKLFKQFLYLLPNGFSYPTTITMAFLRSGFPVCFEPVKVAERNGKSHIRPIRDGIRFLVIIFKIATLYSPLKIFVPASGVFFLLGAGWYAYTYITQARFTNMSLLLFTAAAIIFLIGLISEQITALTYSRS